MQNQNISFKNIILSIVFGVIDLITLVYGIGLFFLGIDEGAAKMAYGASLISLFFLIRLWRKEYKRQNEK